MMTDLREMSRELELKTGADSIDTIERVYDTTESGAFRCAFPDCQFVRRNSVMMWYHLHFGQKHGLSFGVRTPYEAWKSTG